MTATSSGLSRRTRFFVRRSSFAAPVNSMKVAGVAITARTVLAVGRLVSLDGGEKLLAAKHALNFLPPLRLSERFDARVGRIARQLLHTEVTIGSARDLRQVSDRQHLGARCKPLQRLPDRMRRLTADPGVDLVEDDRLAAADRGDRERDAGKLAARRRLRNGRER